MKIKNTLITRFTDGTFEPIEDLIAVEEPLEIRLGFGPKNKRTQMNLAVTMRTPGQDENLALGFLYTEGLVQDFKDILSIKPCIDKKTREISQNIIRIELAEHLKIEAKDFQRNFYATSSCGICGKASIEQIEQQCPVKIPHQTVQLTSKQITQLPNLIHQTQSVFKYTGGIHATTLFNSALEIINLSEDIGRHNALDKTIGLAWAKNLLPLNHYILLLSGRAGFELIQKAAMAGCSIVCSIGAPSSLAVETAQQFNITLIGFLKPNRFNIYSHPHRVIQQ